jgi:hypothetical protein
LILFVWQAAQAGRPPRSNAVRAAVIVVAPNGVW